MKYILIVFSLLTIMTPFAIAQDTYGAIAYSSSTGVFGKTTMRPDRATAESIAIGNCGEWDCKAVVWVRNACAAFAVGLGNAYGWAWDVVPANAEMNAIAECSARTSNCAIVTSICSYE